MKVLLHAVTNSNRIETRTQGSSHIWQLLRNSCEEDAGTAEALIQAAGLSMP